MSRNMRHRSTPPPAQKQPQSSPQQSQGSDSDDDYGGVDDISGSEDDEPNVEVAEERAIISSEGEEDPVVPRSYEEYGQWEGFAFEDDSAALDNQFFEQAIQKTSSVEESLDEDPTSEKHVHWEDSESETMGDSDIDGFWPDIFLDKNEIDPHLLRQIEKDEHNGHFSDDGFHYGEVETDEEEEDHEDAAEESSDADSDSSGYDSDESGMTTDEEDISTRFIPPERSVLRANSEISTSSEEVPRRRGVRAPVMASWTHNSDTPYAIADMGTTKVKVFNMRRFRDQYEMQSRATPMTSPARNMLQESPMISNSGNIMMSAMMDDPFNDNVSGQAIGGPEAFYPWTYVDANGTIENQDSSSMAGSDDCDDEDLWNIDDLLNFGDQYSDDEEEAEPSDESPTGAEDGAPSSTPARPTTARSEDQVHPLLNHFSAGTVGAFRFNQNRHQLLNRTSVTRESLAFGSAHMEGTIRGVKAGRLQHANTPITPVRKKKRPIPAFESSPASPVTNKKRKFNGDDHSTNLKRSRGLTM